MPKPIRFFRSATRLKFSVIGLMVVFLLSACSDQQKPVANNRVEMAPLSQLPVEVQRSALTVQQAYQFAVANPSVLKELPCYCGCGPVGHTSNYSCYVAEFEDGSSAFDGHALGCGICVDIALDAKRMLEQGKPITEIRTVIDQTYSMYGPSNKP